MADQKQPRATEKQQRRQSRPATVIRIFRAFKRQYDGAKTRTDKKESDHKVHERMTARWTRRVGQFTVVLAFAAILSDGIIYFQLREMKVSREDSDDTTAREIKVLQAQADAVTKSAAAGAGQLQEMLNQQRAWVGPTDAAFKEAPKLNTAAQAQVSLINSGREPATNFQFIAYPPFPTSAPNDPAVVDVLNGNRDKCFAQDALAGGSTVYPNVTVGGFGGSPTGETDTYQIPAEWITQPLLDKQSIIMLTGCFIYRTAGASHHSSFCYFWNGDTTAFNHLNICMSAGNDAD